MAQHSTSMVEQYYQTPDVPPDAGSWACNTWIDIYPAIICLVLGMMFSVVPNMPLVSLLCVCLAAIFLFPRFCWACTGRYTDREPRTDASVFHRPTLFQPTKFIPEGEHPPSYESCSEIQQRAQIRGMIGVFQDGRGDGRHARPPGKPRPPGNQTEPDVIQPDVAMTSQLAGVRIAPKATFDEDID